MNKILDSAVDWLMEQQRMERGLFLMIDSLAEPNPIPELFAADLMHEYSNLYQGTELDQMAGAGPWLIALPSGFQLERLNGLLNTPERHWGWLASAHHLPLTDHVQHWRDRMLADERGGKVLYRFQDNRVQAHHLTALSDEQKPELMGPIEAMLCWYQGAWCQFTNPAPAQRAESVARPWLAVAEPLDVRKQVQRENLQQWLWQEQAEAVTRLASTQHFPSWLDQQLESAERWGWTDMPQLQFLLSQQLQPELAAATWWQVQEGETPDAHYQRCQQQVSKLRIKH